MPHHRRAEDDGDTAEGRSSGTRGTGGIPTRSLHGAHLLDPRQLPLGQGGHRQQEGGAEQGSGGVARRRPAPGAALPGDRRRPSSARSSSASPHARIAAQPPKGREQGRSTRSGRRSRRRGWAPLTHCRFRAAEGEARLVFCPEA
jgi:hypothetical protein